MENVPYGWKLQETPLLGHVITVTRRTWNCRVVAMINVLGLGVKCRMGCTVFLVNVHCGMFM